MLLTGWGCEKRACLKQVNRALACSICRIMWEPAQEKSAVISRGCWRRAPGSPTGQPKADEEEVDLSSLKLAPDVWDSVTEHMPKLRELYKALPAHLRKPGDQTEEPMTLTDFLSIVRPSDFQSFLRELDTVKIEASVLGDLDSTMLNDLIQSPAQFLQNREEVAPSVLI